MPQSRPDRHSLAMDEIDILLIEEDPACAELIEVALLSLPVPQRIRHCRKVGEALDWLACDAARLAPSALVLLEPSHASDAGCASIVALRAAPGLRHLPIVVLVGADEPFAIAAAYRCGVNSVVHKPLDPLELAAATQQIAAYWLLRNVSALEHEG